MKQEPLAKIAVSGCVLFQWVFLVLPDDEAVVEVNIPGSESREAILRKRTAGILDMGGVSTQIAYEVPKTVSFASSQQVIICTNFLLLIWFHLTCLHPFLFCFLSLNTPLLCLLRYLCSTQEKETGGSQGKPP